MNNKRPIRIMKMIIPILLALMSNSPLTFSQENGNEMFDPLEKSWPSQEKLSTDWPEPVVDTTNFLFLQANRLETGIHEGNDSYTWDIQSWYGNDNNKLWLKSEAEGTFGGSLENAEIQALYSRLITAFWNVQIGGRYDINPDPERSHLVLGLQGLAPYWLEIDTAAFLSNKGDLTFRAELEYELLLTQKLILQPRLEINVSTQDIPELRLGSGINNTELGLRLRYEIRREVAPYVGFSWKKSYGSTADFIRTEGDKSSDFSFIVGLRLWY